MIGMSGSAADLVEERDAFLAAGRFAAEVHVLDHEVDRLARASTARPSAGVAAPTTRAPCNESSTSKAVRTRLVVVDDEDRTVGQARLQRACGDRAHGGDANTRAPRAAYHTVRVATEGGTAAARHAGCQAASCPMPHSASTPPTR